MLRMRHGPHGGGERLTTAGGECPGLLANLKADAFVLLSGVIHARSLPVDALCSALRYFDTSMKQTPRSLPRCRTRTISFSLRGQTVIEFDNPAPGRASELIAFPRFREPHEFGRSRPSVWNKLGREFEWDIPYNCGRPGCSLYVFDPGLLW